MQANPCAHKVNTSTDGATSSSFLIGNMKYNSIMMPSIKGTITPKEIKKNVQLKIYDSNNLDLNIIVMVKLIAYP
jgi:hypothetical protein